MKKATKAIFFISISMLVLHACTTTKKIVKENTNSADAPTADDLQRGQIQYSDLTSDDLQQGYHTYTAKCGECHKLKIPNKFTVDQWNDIFPKMAKKAKLSDQEYKETQRYVMIMQSKK
ncbi:MAG: cytochrome c [Bacteroidia bacterium]